LDKPTVGDLLAAEQAKGNGVETDEGQEQEPSAD
jgi:hypothetical protein